MSSEPQRKRKRSQRNEKTEEPTNLLSADQFVQLTCLIDDPKVTIYVGPEAKAYSLSRKLLCHESAYFAAAFEGNFMEGTSQTLTMEEDDPDAFELLIQFLYTKRVVLPRQDPPNFPDDITRYLGLIKLADKIGLLELAEIAHVANVHILKGQEPTTIQRSHLNILFAEDWPNSEVCHRQKAAFLAMLSREFMEASIMNGSCLTPYLRANFTEVPGLACAILPWIARRIEAGADEVQTATEYEALLAGFYSNSL